ncbi:hypothetical protein GCM10023080_032170 [Streptomyces pseudoechinosporeus]
MATTAHHLWFGDPAGPVARAVKNLLQILVSHVAELLTNPAWAFVVQGQVWWEDAQ